MKRTRWALALCSGVIVLVAGVHILAILHSYRLSENERVAVRALKAIAEAEHDFWSNDRDGNLVNDFWTGDVAGLYGLNVGGKPVSLVEADLASADAAPLAALPGGPVPYHGYLFVMLRHDNGRGEMRPYQKDTDRSGRSVHNSNSFGICAYPARLGESGASAYIINESRTILRLPEGKAVSIWEDPSPWEKLVHLSTDTHTILIEGKSIFLVPSERELRVTVSKQNGQVVHSERFSGGWRIEVTAGSVSSRTEAGPGLIELHSKPDLNGRDIYRQYYSVIGDSLRLVRLENNDGHIVPNIYSAPNKTIGPNPPSRTVEQWEQALRCDNEAEILAVLVWLGGVHSRATDSPADVLRETKESAQLVHTVRARPAVRERLIHLERSSNGCIAEAAKLAREEKTDREDRFPGSTY